MGVRLAVEGAYQKQLTEKHAEALDSVRRSLRARLRNAAKVLSGQPGS